jgi:hypothetical protein
MLKTSSVTPILSNATGTGSPLYSGIEYIDALFSNSA